MLSSEICCWSMYTPNSAIKYGLYFWAQTTEHRIGRMDHPRVHVFPGRHMSMDAQMKSWLTRLGRCQIMPQLAILGINLHQTLRGHGSAGLLKTLNKETRQAQRNHGNSGLAWWGMSSISEHHSDGARHLSEAKLRSRSAFGFACGAALCASGE